MAPGIALGHRRLAIIDPAGGDQPMYNEDGSIAVIFNGCIYNFRELRRTLRPRATSSRPIAIPKSSFMLGSNGALNA